MKLDLVVELPQGGRGSFTAIDEVRGQVKLLQSRKQEPPLEILVSLQGRVRTSFPLQTSTTSEALGGQFTEPPLQKATHILFTESTVAHFGPKGDGMDGCNPDSALFSLSFPSNGLCCGGDTTRRQRHPLPPSLVINSSALKVRIAYSVTATTQRRGLFKRRKTVRQIIEYQPCSWSPEVFPHQISATLPTSIRQIVMLPITKLGARDDNAVTLPQDPEYLPAYSPALALDVAIPGSAMLGPGCAIPLQVCLSCSPDLLRSVGPLELRSTSVRLRGTTTARIGASFRSHQDSWLLFSATGSVPITKTKFEVDYGAWRDCRVPQVPLTFESCLVARTYTVEVTVGVSSRLRPHIQYIHTSVDVVITDPPPVYVNSD